MTLYLLSVASFFLNQFLVLCCLSLCTSAVNEIKWFVQKLVTIQNTVLVLRGSQEFFSFYLQSWTFNPTNCVCIDQLLLPSEPSLLPDEKLQHNFIISSHVSSLGKFACPLLPLFYCGFYYYCLLYFFGFLNYFSFKL